MGLQTKLKEYFTHLSVFSVCLIAFETGICYGWTSPILPKLNSPDSEVNPLGKPVTLDESAWIVSSMSLALMLGPVFSSIGLRHYTKKTILLGSMVPLGASHIVLFFAKQAGMFIFARVLMGVGTGAAWAVLGTFVAEISEDKNRGFLGSVCGIMSNLGTLLVFVTGPYLNIVWFGLVNLIPVILFYVTFYFVPDSPYDLVMRQQHDLARKGLQTLRQKRNVEKELEFIKETIELDSKEKVNYSVFIRDPVLRKGLLLSITLMACQAFSGVLAVSSYAESIFRLAGDLISPEYCPMIFGVFSTIAIVVGSLLVDKIGRKVLITGACMMAAFSLFTLGLYFFRKEAGYDVQMISLLPLISVVLFMMAFNLALGVIPWIITGEVFHSSVKRVASTITSLSNFLMSFIVTMCFPYMSEYFGMGWTFWCFALCMVLGSLFCLFRLPETKGKNFQQIQEILKQK